MLETDNSSNCACDLSLWFLYVKLQLIFPGLKFSWDVLQLRSARGIRCYSVIHPVPEDSYIKIILFPLAPGKLGADYELVEKTNAYRKKTHRLQRGSWSTHSPALTLYRTGKKCTPLLACSWHSHRGAVQGRTKPLKVFFPTLGLLLSQKFLKVSLSKEKKMMGKAGPKDPAVYRYFFPMAWESWNVIAL